MSIHHAVAVTVRQRLKLEQKCTEGTEWWLGQECPTSKGGRAIIISTSRRVASDIEIEQRQLTLGILLLTVQSGGAMRISVFSSIKIKSIICRLIILTLTKQTTFSRQHQEPTFDASELEDQLDLRRSDLGTTYSSEQPLESLLY